MLTSAQCRDRRVIDIALACGFGAVSYFNRVFRRRFGVSPSELRRTPMAADLARRP
jgi:AraC-like DNA-binding protein